jgi:secretion/DNA translocation related CpaE-like protein
VPTAAEARRWWAGAAHVLVGADLLDETVPARLGRRPGVVVVTRGDPSPAVWQAALDLGAEEVVRLPDDDSALVARLLASPDDGAAGAPVVGVVGGSGGAGASVLAVALALAGARLGRTTLLVDLDPCGGGLDLALGAEDVPGARWPDLAAVTGLVPAATLLDALPSRHEVHVLAPAREPGAGIPVPSVAAVLDSAAAAAELVVIDLPRADAEVRATALARCDVVLVVVTPDVRGSAAAQATCASLRSSGADLRVVVRTQPTSGLDAQAVADWLALPLAAELAHDPRLTAALDRGDPPGLAARSRSARVAQALLGQLVGGR